MINKPIRAMKAYLFYLFCLPVLLAAVTAGCRQEVVSPSFTQSAEEQQAAIDADLERQAELAVQKMLAEDKARAARLISTPTYTGTTDKADSDDADKTNASPPNELVDGETLAGLPENTLSLPQRTVDDLITEAERQLQTGNRVAARETVDLAVQMRDSEETPMQRISYGRRIGEIYRLLGRKDQAMTQIKQALETVAVIPGTLERLTREMPLIELWINVDGGEESLAYLNQLDQWTKEHADEKLLADISYPARRDSMLKSIAKSRAWIGTLEEAWEAIELIGDAATRDAALAEVIDMLIRTEKYDDATAWIDEISDPAIRDSLMKRIDAARQQ